MGLSSEQLRAVVVLLAGALLVVLNQTLLSPALPVIMQDLHVDATTVQWLTSGYSLVEAIVIPLSAYLMGRFATRKLFIGGICIFGAGTLLAAFAPSFIFLLLGRMLQACATGFVMPMTFAVILVIFPREKRGSAMGLVSLIIGFAPAVGPSLSGVLVQTIGWRALFVLIAILAVIVIVTSAISLKFQGDFERTTFDKPSVALSSAGLLCLLYGLSSITSSAYVWVQVLLIVVGVVLMILFVRRQFKLPVPFLRVQVLKASNFRTDVIIVMCFQAALVGCGVLLPIYLQNILGITPLQTGLMMLPGAIIGAVTAVIAGRLFDRFGARKLVIPGTLVVFIGGIGLITFGLDTSVVFITCVYTLLPLGMEFTMTPLNTWGINSLPNKVIQHATATENTLNQIAASLGTAILVSLSATSSFLFPDMAAAEQQMVGIHIAFCFTAIMLAVIFVLVLVRVHDKKPGAAGQAEFAMEAMPADGILEGAAKATGAAVAQNQSADLRINVSLVMNKNPYFVGSDDTLVDVANLLVENKTSGMPVVDRASGKVVGFISDGDIMKYIGRHDSSVLDSTMMLYRAPDTEAFVSRIYDLMHMNVMNIATKKAICVSEDTQLEDACKLLADKRLKKVPVVSDGKLVGSLSRSDIVRSTMENLAMIEQQAKAE